MQIFSGMAHKLAVNKATSSIAKVHKEGRLKFLDNEQVEYSDKQGIKVVNSVDEIASIIWNNLEAGLGGQASYTQVRFMPEDVKEIILKLRRATR